MEVLWITLLDDLPQLLEETGVAVLGIFKDDLSDIDLLASRKVGLDLLDLFVANIPIFKLLIELVCVNYP